MICYTCITNKYDNLKDPRVVTPGWKYICYSDEQQKSDIWETVITKKPQGEIKILGYKVVIIDNLNETSKQYQ